MKKAALILSLGLYSALSFADTVTVRKPVVMKEPLKVDFHQMIVITGEERHQLQADIMAEETKKELSKEEAYAKQIQEQKVIDFVDVEIGVGEAPAMVDRRSR